MDRANLAGHTILVVEEQPLIALDLQRALEGAGAEVVVARNKTEALGHVGQLSSRRAFSIGARNQTITEWWRAR